MGLDRSVTKQASKRAIIATIWIQEEQCEVDRSETWNRLYDSDMTVFQAATARMAGYAGCGMQARDSLNGARQVTFKRPNLGRVPVATQ